MKLFKCYIVVYGSLLFSLFLLNACRPLKNMVRTPSVWSGKTDSTSKAIQFDPAKKTVMIVADYKLTELFDMIAPFYLFNATEKANVYIVAKDRTPILIKRDLFVKPQITFDEAESLGINPDVIVIPALSVRNNQQDSTLIAWIRKNYTATTSILAICDGASTAAATGLYDGKYLTCHASDFAGISSYFNNPNWVQNISVTKSGNLYSTAGVSNAVEGSLAVIDELFGSKVTQKVINDIHYPHQQIKFDHRSVGVSGSNKATAFKKIFFRRNRNLGVLLEDGTDEFVFASVLDTYGRTFPAALNTYSRNDSIVRTKYGLTLIHTGNNSIKNLDELHVIMPESFSNEDEVYFGKVKVIRYDVSKEGYPIDMCLQRIGKQYGKSFEQLVKVSLDYN